MSQIYKASSGGSSGTVVALEGNDSVVVGPNGSGVIHTVGTGSITTVGNAGTNTETVELTGLTNHNVLVGAGTATITKVPPSTAGFVLTSNGASADPSFQASSGGGGLTEYFAAYKSSPSANVVGAGTPYDVIFDTAYENASGSYNATTGVYTAPSTGVYFFTHSILITGGDNTNTVFLTYWHGSVFYFAASDLGPSGSTNNQVALNSSTLLSMTAGDTMNIRVNVGGISNNCGVFGAGLTGADFSSTFSGFKIA